MHNTDCSKDDVDDPPENLAITFVICRMLTT